MLVYYSIANDRSGRCERQWRQSIRSLRQYNRSVPVHLLIYGRPARSLVSEAKDQDVTVHLISDYQASLREAQGDRRKALAYYPTLHKFISLRYLPRLAAAQILYADCDTFFFGDVAGLLNRHARRHWYAREEPQSRRSHYGYDASYVDEELLAKIARSEGLRFIPPYNTGVCIMNHGLADLLIARSGALLEFAWRFLVGLRDRTICPPELRARVRRAMVSGDRHTGLDYPSSNGWIVEEVATWMTLGTIPGLTHGVLQRKDVLQNGEFKDVRGLRRSVMVHYYRDFEKPFFARVERSARGAPRRHACETSCPVS